MTITVEGRRERFEALPGESLLDCLRREGVSVDAPCGGRGLCGKCLVRVLSGDYTATAGGADVLHGDPASPSVRACAVFPRGDIVAALDAAVFGRLASIKDNASDKVTLGNGMNGAVPSSPSPRLEAAARRLGAALDIGTTTLGLRLLDLESGAVLDTVSVLNSQRSYGADVMSRIGAAMEGKTAELYRRINTQIAELLSGFCAAYRVDRLESLCVAGNTTMLHLFTNTDPSPMGRLPYDAVFLESRTMSGADLCLPVNTVTLLPGIASFVGADIAAGIAVTDLCGGGPALLLDLGTNGEMALSAGGKLLCCSTAAGPALEGAGISCGMGSVAGAINRVYAADSRCAGPQGDIRYTVIGGGPAAGICGSGLADAVALMLDQGVIDETGAFTDGGRETFAIAEHVELTGRDVRQFQLAKGAIMTGIKMLCARAGLAPADLEKVYVAGGLGFYMNMDSAVKTGLFPPDFAGRAAICGNTSLEGAARCLTGKDSFLDQCKNIAARAEVIDLAAEAGFTDLFAESMMFG